MTVIYFDTSAINWLFDNVLKRQGDVVATKKLQIQKGRRWMISSVVLHEILGTKDLLRREKLIYFSQNLFDRELMPTPSEIILGYVEKNFPKIEKPKSLISKSSLAETWKDLVDNPNKTFVSYEDDLNRRSKIVHSLYKELHDIFKKNNDLDIKKDTDLSINLDFLIAEVFDLKKSEYSREGYALFKISVFYLIFIFLTAEISNDEMIGRNLGEYLFNKKDDRLYKAQKLKDVLVKLKPLLYQGPIVILSLMTFNQFKKNPKFKRGTHNDSLHALYLTYADQFFTSDRDFSDFKDHLIATESGDGAQTFNALKIHLMQESNFALGASFLV